ncbi:MAG: bifunctional UDP-N-acetylglucosamine diphosphorylase/glucosamine-1-phosphate N-acetyltransferase GlmU [Actinobacteria bacterium]|nr:bifunctional UDP-N-acetylglucosamine diphosphorylase/glucosamine-1-phosphate N-acetyltransferase GlmU [Actinomycetota bacterium]
MKFLKKLNIVILAAGKGKRMLSSIPKVLHNIIDKPMIYYVLKEAQKLSPDNIYVITGYGHEILEDYLKSNFSDVKTVYQENQLGTGHAVNLIKNLADENWQSILILTGDSPLIKSETLINLVDKQQKGSYAVSIITALLDNPAGYGRIIKNKLEEIIKIVEEPDATDEEKLIKEINTSIYCFDSKALFDNISLLNTNNLQNEYYLTDIIEKFNVKNLKAAALLINDSSEILGVNDRVQLSIVQRLMRKRINERLMFSGVTITDPYSTYIGVDAEIQNDVIIEPFSFIKGRTVIKRGCIIGPFVQISDSEILDDTMINNAVIRDAKIGKNNNIGPYSYIRPETLTNNNVKVGGFCEVKKSIVGDNSKIPHLTYIGDTEIGKNVNIGASSVTCNYDGFRKNKTIIDDNVFIGSDTMLVPPVRIGKGAIVAAGSVITGDVPDNAMAFSRGKQINKLDGAVKYRKKKKNLK